MCLVYVAAGPPSAVHVPPILNLSASLGLAPRMVPTTYAQPALQQCDLFVRCHRVACTQVVLRHGQLHMCRNQEMVRSGKDGRGFFIVINGLVRIGYRDPLGNTQEYFLGTGACPTPGPASYPPWAMKGSHWSQSSIFKP